MANKQPFFSIIIPTYNRAKLLKAAIEIILQQTCHDFEIIVCDNFSTDQTELVVKSFKDKRVKYFKNKTTTTAEKNIKKSLSYGKGTYLFTTGDDDFILFPNTLAKIKEILLKEKFGFLRLNLIEKKFIGKGLRKSIVSIEEDIRVNKNSSPEKLIEFFQKIGSGHLAGLVIKNHHGISDKMIDCPDIPWIEIIYHAAQRSGAYFLSNYYMIITWSQGAILAYYNVSSNNRLMFENYTKFTFRVIPEKSLSNYKLQYYNKFVMLQPVIKLYSGNSNLFKFNKRLMQLEPRLKKNITFWLFAISAVVIPKFLWRFIRVIQHKSKDTFSLLKNKDTIYKRFYYLNQEHYSTI